MSIKAQRGVTLVELMVSITIGLLILLVITQIYMSSFSTQRTQDDVSRIQETARFSFELISREFRKAGFRDYTAQVSNFCSTLATGSAVAAVNDAMSINPGSADFSGAPQVSVLNKSDVVRLRYYGQNATATSPILDCHGYPVAANQLVEDTLFVANDPNNNNEPTLFCYTSNPTPVTATHPGQAALVSGIESLQILYGEDTDIDGIANRYIPWNLLANADNVLSAKVSVVARSPNPVTPDAPEKTFKHFSSDSANPYPAATNSDGGAVFNAPGDRRLRQMFSTDIALRNNFAYCETN